MFSNVVVVAYILLIIVYIFGPFLFRNRKINTVKLNIIFSVIGVLVIVLYLICAKFPPKFGPIGM
ncbi:MAG: hypothetical protein PHX70_11820 [Clostridium sp.]|nr:hypothetical protein [Clostridium sp.]